MGSSSVGALGGSHAPAAPECRDGAAPLDKVSVGSYQELLTQAATSPRNFTFNWRGVNFAATLEGCDGGLHLTLHSDLAQLPYSAENAGERRKLLAVVDGSGKDGEGNLRVVCGQKIVIEDTIDLPRTIDSTVNSIVTSLTILVLRLAPCLDFLAENVIADGGKPA